MGINRLGNRHSCGISRKKESIPIPFRSSLVTVIFNYFGYTSFENFSLFWKMIGVLSENFEKRLDWFHFSVSTSIEVVFFKWCILPISIVHVSHVLHRGSLEKIFSKQVSLYLPKQSRVPCRCEPLFCNHRGTFQVSNCFSIRDFLCVTFSSSY